MKYVILIIFSLNIACNPLNRADNVKVSMANAPIMVYKTVNDYFNNVPIILSEDKSKIVSYPHPTDIMIGEKYTTPTLLKNGYLLDNRGINLNVAFIELTYEEYAKLNNTLPLEELKAMIIDDNPITELYFCGYKSGFNNIEKQINRKIVKRKLDDYKRLK